MFIAWANEVASEGKGRWIPGGWHLPLFVISLALAVVATLVARKRSKR